jgi:hypothetical protein
MQLNDQIESLSDIGFQFRDRNCIQQTLDAHEWWQYYNSPYSLLVERVCFRATCSQSRICDNVVAWDLKHLRHEKWFESVVNEMAELSGNTEHLQINGISSDAHADKWSMQFELRSKRNHSVFDIGTRYPHKYAPMQTVFEIAECFESNSHLFVCLRDDYDPVVCWLSKSVLPNLETMLSGRFRPISKSAR